MISPISVGQKRVPKKNPIKGNMSPKTSLGFLFKRHVF